MIRCYPSKGKRKALKMCTWFARGAEMAGAGGSVMDVCQDYLYRGPAFFYGMTDQTLKLIDEAKRLHVDWYYADNAYYFGRSLYFRITKNRYMHDGCGKYSPARWKDMANQMNLSVSGPQRNENGHIVITTQSELFCGYQLGMSRDAWVKGVIEELRKYTDREIKVCHKPERTPYGFPHDPAFEEFMPNAWALITYSSSTAVKAIMDGVPAFTLGPQAMCEPVANFDLSQIENPYFPPIRTRMQWLYNLAANQWTQEEIKTGIAWRDLQNNAGRFEGIGIRGRRRDAADLVGTSTGNRRYRRKAKDQLEADPQFEGLEA